MDFYLNNFVFTGKDAGGVSVKDLVVTILNECGVDHCCPAPEGCVTVYNPVTQSNTITTAQVNSSFEALLSYITQLETRIAALEA